MEDASFRLVRLIKYAFLHIRTVMISGQYAVPDCCSY